MLYIVDTEAKRREAQQAVSSLRRTPLMQVEIKPYKKNRSTSQNRLYWMWVGIIADDTGADVDDLHESLKVRFLGVEHKVINGVACIIPKSSAKLTTKEFTTYLEAIESLGLELGITLPIPDDYGVAMGQAA